MLRRASSKDAAAITACVKAAYAPHAARMGKPPGPLLDDYAELIERHIVWVVAQKSELAGVLVLIEKDDYLLLDNVAVQPALQGQGTGKLLMQQAELEAVRLGYARIRLYTHESMIENRRLYQRLSYAETGRKVELGLNRVYMEKRVTKT